MDRPAALYARAVPGAEALPRVHDVWLEGEILHHYVRQRFGVSLATGSVAQKTTKRQKTTQKKQRQPAAVRLEPCVRPNTRCKSTVASYEHLAYYWRRPGDLAPTSDAEAVARAPKLHAIARSIADDPQARKTCVILHRESGYDVLAECLTRLGVPHVVLRPVTGTKTTTSGDNLAKLKRFNQPSNDDGRELRAILLTAEQHSEGVSLQHVRRIVLGDLSPGNERPRWALLQQRMGRALRMCSHARLADPAQRQLDVELYVVRHRLPAPFPPTLDEEKLALVEGERRVVQGAMDSLRAVSLDATYYAE